jgi:hypothetical protein
MKIWIATVDSHRYLDDFEYSYLPLYRKVFGVYHTRDEAVKAVFQKFCNEENYDIYFEQYAPNGEYLGYDHMFYYKDAKYGGYAIYGIDYHLETIEEEKQ